MHISISSASALVLFLASVLAAPTTTNPIVTSSSPFTLSSTLVDPTTGNPAFANLNLTSYQGGGMADFGYAVLSTGPALTFALNGTAADFANGTTDMLLVSDPPIPNVSFGFFIDRVNITGNVVEIALNQATSGVDIEEGKIALNLPAAAFFYACDETLVTGRTITQLFYRTVSGSVPVGCSDVFLNVNYS